MYRLIVKEYINYDIVDRYLQNKNIMLVYLSIKKDCGALKIFVIAQNICFLVLVSTIIKLNFSSSGPVFCNPGLVPSKAWTLFLYSISFCI